MITYTVKEVATDHIVVQYEDESIKFIPIRVPLNKRQIEDIICLNAPGVDYFESVESVPFTVNETNTVKTGTELAKEREELADAEAVTYSTLRQNSYPSIGDQLDALYWARKGDTTELDALDAQIQQVKIDYPKNMEPITRAEYKAILDAASE